MKHCLAIRWGRVGTKGNVRKIFFNSKEESIENFKKIFHKKSGEHWNQVNDVYNGAREINTTSDDRLNCKWNLDEIFRKIITELSTTATATVHDDDFKKLVLKYIKIFYRQIENDPNEQKSLQNLTTKSIDRCLCEYYIFVFFENFSSFFSLQKNSHPKSIIQIDCIQ